MAKGQSSVEFLMIIAALTFAFTVLFVIIQGNINDADKKNEETIIKKIVEDTQDEINIALRASEGYEREFLLPLNVNGRDYTAEIVDNLIYIKTEMAAIALPTSNITGVLQKGANRIIKKNGGVYLNP